VEVVPHVVAPQQNVQRGSTYGQQLLHPIYQNHHHELNHIERNIFVHPHTVSNIDAGKYYWEDRNSNTFVMKQMEEKKELAQKVKELEFLLASQRENTMILNKN
jgi:hypothetical protein